MLEKINVITKVIFINFQRSGFLSQILNGWIPYVIIIWSALKIGKKVIIPNKKQIIRNTNINKKCLK